MNAKVVRSCHMIARVSGGVAALIGCAGALGWALDIEPMRSPFSDAISIKTNAAICLMLLGVALMMLAPGGVRPAWVVATARALACVGMLVGAATLIEHLAGRDLGIDQLLFEEPPGAPATASPGRMGPPASTSFFLCGMALLLLDVRTQRGRRAPAQWLALLVGLIALLPLIGYAYSIQPLYGVAKYTGIALHTALAIAALAVGVLAARPTAGIMAQVAADDAGGEMARRLLIPAILIPFLLGWLRTVGQRAGWFDEAFGRPLLVLSLIVSFTTLVWWNARALSFLGRDRTRVLEQLHRSRDTFYHLIHNNPFGVYVVDADFRLREVSLGSRKVFENVRPLIGRDFAEVLRAIWPEPFASQAIATFRRTLETGEPYVSCSTIERRQDIGQVEAYDWRIERVTLPDGRFGVVCYFYDLSERQRWEAALRESEERLRLAVGIAQLGTFLIDLRTDAVTVNDTGREIFGWSRDEPLTFAKIQAHVHPDERDEVMRQVNETLSAGGPAEFELEHRIVRTDGEIRWLRVRGRTIFEQQPTGNRREPVRRVGTYLDVTDQKEAEAQREQLLARERAARADAERASEAKSEFLATLSHELRTPLTPVLLTVSLMESHPGLPPELREDVATIRRNVELESQLISDLLDLTRIARGKLQLDVQEVDLHLIVRSAIDICQREASARLTVDLAAARHTVRGDGTRLQQVFWNLINNAMKFTPPQGSIAVRSRNTDDGGGRVRVEVVDTGVGIDPDVLPKLFTAFEQGEVRAARQHAGLGLGLTISRKLAEAHGGTITAHSEGRGRGAMFIVELPVIDAPVRGAAPAPAAPIPAANRPLNVLLVEDHVASLHVMERLLRQIGHQVTGVTSVAGATAAAQRDGFDLVISDLGLPDGSGLDVIRQLGRNRAVRAIALTGYGMDSDIAASREAGFAEHLTKPVDVATLQAAIERVTAGV